MTVSISASRILSKVEKDGNTDFVSLLNDDELWDFLKQPLARYSYWEMGGFDLLEKVQNAVVEELQRRVQK